MEQKKKPKLLLGEVPTSGRKGGGEPGAPGRSYPGSGLSHSLLGLSEQREYSAAPCEQHHTGKHGAEVTL